MVWFLDGCSALNLSSSGNQSYLAKSYPEWNRDGVILGRMFCPKPLLIREPELPGYKEKSYPEWKGYCVVLGRMFCPKPLLIRELLYKASLLQALPSTRSPDLKQIIHTYG
jgi:hypothetical protein